MKIKLCRIIIFICLFLSSCRASHEPLSPSVPPGSTGPHDTLPETSEALPTDIPSHSEDLTTPIREFGDSTAYIQMDGNLMVRILYPESNIEPLNEAINTWVNETVAYYQTECQGWQETEDCGELTAEYESYEVGDKWISIKIKGIFDKPYSAHPIDIIATFHADKESGQIITLEHLLIPQGRLALETKVAADMGIEPALIDNHFLEHWILTSEGLEITLARGDYLPMSAGTQTLFYPYEALEGILSFSKDSFPENVPSHEPEVTPPVGNIAHLPQTLPADSEKPMVALTFDDGPGKHTSRLLDIFASHGGKGTFFVIGNLLDGRAEVLNRIIAEGHEIGGHSWDHRQLTKLNTTDLSNQLVGTRTKIHQLTGIDAPLLRPPYGSYNSQVKNMCKNLGIVMVNWSLDTLDWKYKDAEKICHTILSEVRDGDIILCHDLHGSTVDAMEKVIPELLSRGYQLVTVSELLDQRADVIEAGEVYYKRE